MSQENNVVVSGKDTNNPVYEEEDAYESIVEINSSRFNHNSSDNILYEHRDESRDESLYSQPDEMNSTKTYCKPTL